MTTAEILEAMTDRGKFELLATSILRKANKNYEAVLHPGVNAAGEPVKSPIDGFCLIPGSNPPHFIMIQHTTTDRAGLEKKWLYDNRSTPKTTKASTNDDGDLTKARQWAEELRRDFPNGQFTLVLTTNQRPPIDLSAKVYTQANKFHLFCDIWDQSLLADFLDTRPEGQWLRKEHLGIAAETLSESLLRSICEQSVASYQREIVLDHPNRWVTRLDDERIFQGIQSKAHAVQIFIGESGYGKSTAVCRALQKHLSTGGLGLWAPAHLVETSVSLDGLVDQALHTFCPSLLIDAGKEALRFTEGSQLLVVIDDINRAKSPSQLVRHLLAWSSPQQTNSTDSQKSIPPFLILCPVWPQVWATVSLEFNRASWIDTIYTGPMTLTEGATAIASVARTIGIALSQVEAEALSRRLGNDPILIGLFGSLLTPEDLDKLNFLTENVVEKFIETRINEASSLCGARYIPADFHTALNSLALQMLQRRRLYPSWEEIQGWFQNSPERVAIMRELIQFEKLCRVSDVAGKASFVFRHDRIQEMLLTRAASVALSEFATAADLLDEPYYAEIIGRALSRSSRTKEFLQEVRRRNPLALIEAIRNFGTPTSDHHHMIVEAAKEWANSEVATKTVPESVLDAVIWSLVETDSPAVLEITESFPRYPLTLLARLRNGSADSGARYCTGRGELEPAVNDQLRDRMLDIAKRNHGQQIVNDLKHLLRTPNVTDDERRGFLALAGYMATDELEEAIASCWSLVADKASVLVEAIWAAIHCCSLQPARLLDLLMSTWVDLPEEDDRPGYPDSVEIAEELRFALARGLPERVINYFVAQYETHESLRWPIIYMFEHVDAASAMDLIVRYGADTAKGLEGTTSFSPRFALLGDSWDGSRDDSRRLSQDSMMRLLELWSNEGNDIHIKQAAFAIWLRAARQEHLNRLRTVDSRSPRYRDVLIKRMRLSDQGVVPDLLAVLPFDGYWRSYWFRFAHTVWCPELFGVTDKQLEALQDTIPTDYSDGWKDPHFHLSELLMQIPSHDAEKLLIKHWEHLQYSPLFIQTALFVGTSKCLELASKSIAKYPAGIKVFRHVSSHFGLMNLERARLVTKRHFDSLIPYLDRLDEGDLWELAEVSQRLGIPEWSNQHLSGKLAEEWRKRYLPTGEDLLQALDELAADDHGVTKAIFWLKDAEKRHESQRVLDIVDRWLGSHPTVNSLRIAAQCIRSFGSRANLSLLDKYVIAGPQDTVVKIKASTHYFVCRRSLD